MDIRSIVVNDSLIIGLFKPSSSVKFKFIAPAARGIVDNEKPHL